MFNIIPLAAVAIFVIAAIVVVRGWCRPNSMTRMVDDVLQAALRDQAADANESASRITCQFCGSTADDSRENCRNCGAPLA